MQRVLGAEEAVVGQRGKKARADGLEHAGMDGDENLNLYGCTQILNLKSMTLRLYMLSKTIKFWLT